MAATAVTAPKASEQPPASEGPKPVAVVPARPTPPGPPRKVVTGEGITITETADGQVNLKTTTTWGEALDTMYSDCTFYSAAIPVLTGQLTAPRAKLLSHACAPDVKKKP